MAQVELKPVSGHTRGVQCVSWNCTGQYLASGSSDKTLRVWIVDGSGSTRPLQNISTASTVEQLCWHPSVPNRFASISGEEELKLWDTRTNRPSATIRTGGGNINLSWSPDGRHIAVGNREDCITVFDVSKAPKMLKRMKFPYEVNEFCWSASGDHLILTTAAADPGGTIQVVEFDRSAGFGESISFPAHTSNCFCMKMHAPSNRLVVGSADSLVSMWDLDDMSCLYTVPRYEGAAKGLSFSGDGSLVAATVEGSGTIDIFAAATGESVTTIETGVENVNAVSWIPQDDKALLAIGLDAPMKGPGAGSSASGSFRGSRAQQQEGDCLVIAVVNRLA